MKKLNRTFQALHASGRARTVMLILAGGLVTAILLALLYGSHVTFERELTATFQRHQLTTARSLAAGVEEVFAEIEDDLRALARHRSIHRGAPSGQGHIDAYYDTHTDILNNITCVDVEGNVITRSPKTPKDHNVSKWPEFLGVKDTHKPWVGEPAKCVIDTTETVVRVFVPIVANGQFNGAICASINLKKLWAKCMKRVETGRKSLCWVVEDNGQVLHHTNSEYVGLTWEQIEDNWRSSGKAAGLEIDEEIEELERRLRKRVQDGDEGTDEHVNALEGVEELVAFTPIRLGNQTYGLAVVTPKSQISAPIAAQEKVTYALMAGLAVICVAGGYAVYRGGRARILLAEERKHAGVLQQSAEALRENEARLRQIIDLVPSRIFTKDTDGRLLLVNRASADSLGMTVEEMTGRLHAEIHPDPEEVKRMLAEDRKVIEGGQTLTIPEERCTDGAGRQRWLHTIKVPYIAADTAKPAILGVAVDITDRKQAEEEIVNLAKFPSENPYPVLRIAGDGKVLYANTAALGLLGHLESGLDKPAPEQWRRIVTEVLQSGSIRRIEVEHKGRVLAFRAVPVAGAGYVNWYGVDITERKRTEEALRAERDKLTHIFETMADGVYVVDQEHDIQYANPVLIRDFGPCEDRKCYEYFHDRNEVCPWCKNEEVWAGKTVRWEWSSAKNGRTYDLIDSPLKNPDGSIWKLEILRDITERKRAEKALGLSHKLLDIANKQAEAGLLLTKFVAEVKIFMGCAAAGIRLLDEEGNIPYEAQVGFSQKFYDSESPLSIKSDQCMCINVIKGNTDPALPFYTEGGSFYMNATTRFLATVSQEDKGQTRNVCNEVGYESVALVPITSEGRVLGLIHVADTRENMVPLETVKMLEEAAMQLGTAIHRVLADEALAASEKQYRTLIENVHDGVYRLDHQGRFAFVNDRVVERSGRPREWFIGRSFLDVIVPEDRQRMQEIFEATMRGESTSPYQTAYRRASGDVLHIEVNSSPLVEGDEIVGMLAVSRDITERRRMEEEQRIQSEITANMSEGVSLVRFDDGVIVYANPKFEEMFGYSPNEMVGKHVSVVNAPTGKPPEGTTTEIRQALDKHGSWRGEINNIKKDGALFWCYASVSVFDHSEHGKVAVSVHTDITERKQAEDEIRRINESYDRIIDNADEVIFRVGAEGGHVVYANPAAERLLGYSQEEWLADPGLGFKIIHPDYVEEQKRVIEEINTTKKTIKNAVLGWIAKDGRQIIIEYTIIPILDEEGNIVCFESIGRDITERKRAEEELERHRHHLEELVEQRTDELKSANKELESFDYTVSHDLRAPLRGIAGFTQAIKEDYADRLDDEGRDHLNRVLKATARMTQLIDDLLRLSGVTLREMNRETVDLSALVGSIAGEIRKAEPSRQVQFIIEPGVTAHGDAALLRLALQNLMDNAWKFTDGRARATIEFGTVEREDVKAYYVRDDGVGFDMAYVDKLFVPFQRLHSQAEFSGTGIGLATVARIMHRHGGKVWGEGAPEKGATFCFTL